MKAVGDKKALTEKTANGWLHVGRGADELKGTMRTTRIQ
jgi:hypothetical protein